MQVPDFEDVYSLLSTYTAKRPRRGPFPLESALTWSILLCAQASNDIRGGMLEIGVEFGTSAFLMLDALRADEHATFVDLKKTDEWTQGINGPYRDKAAYSYIVGDSMGLDKEALPKSCRWIHVDGGHLYRHVANDLELVEDAASEKGITVLDDFFEIRWPDLTVAVVDHLKENENLIPFLLVNRKLYCTHTVESVTGYQEMFASFLAANEREIGQVRSWGDVVMIGKNIFVAKMVMSERLQTLDR